MTSTAAAPSPVLIATLGSEPQVVTAVLDLLRQSGAAIRQVVVVHTIAPGSQVDAACRTLEEAFRQPPYLDQIHLRMAPLEDGRGRPAADVRDPGEVQAAFRTLYREVRRVKQQGGAVHLSIAGGRKTLAVFGMAAAQLLFDEHDHLWHLHSAGEFLESRRLHPQPGDQVHLIPIPVMLWSRISPVLGEIGAIDDPLAAVEAVRRLQLREQIQSARAFVEQALTGAERRAVELLVREGLSDAEIAERLVLSPRTVESQLRSAYVKAQQHWDLPSPGRLTLVRLLSLYYSIQIPGKPG